MAARKACRVNGPSPKLRRENGPWREIRAFIAIWNPQAQFANPRGSWPIWSAWNPAENVWLGMDWSARRDSNPRPQPWQVADHLHAIDGRLVGLYVRVRGLEQTQATQQQQLIGTRADLDKRRAQRSRAAGRGRRGVRLACCWSYWMRNTARCDVSGAEAGDAASPEVQCLPPRCCLTRHRSRAPSRQSRPGLMPGMWGRRAPATAAGELGRSWHGLRLLRPGLIPARYLGGKTITCLRPSMAWRYGAARTGNWLDWRGVRPTGLEMGADAGGGLIRGASAASRAR
jgi:hypothetical protein